MPRTRIRRRRHRAFPLMLAAAAIAVAGWWVYPPDPEAPDDYLDADGLVIPRLTTDRPEVLPETTPQADVPERGERPGLTAVSNRSESAPTQKVQALIESGKKALEGGDLVAARSYFSEALGLATDPDERSMLRAELTRLGNETVFSGRVFENDPLIGRYVIQTGDTLGKIAKANHVSAGLLADINGIRNKNLIRVGQTIKLIHGPFRASVETEAYTMGVYLGNTFVKQFRVGLGEDGSTPRGMWRVGTKLINPTYYPPRGGRIVAADDPANPLGERWIGLHGVSGEAVGQLRYGIHGTNEPESVGKSVSLGCIRMYNEDIEALFGYLIEEHSTVEVR